ncbi:hypothetical protein HZH68_013611 [Vespula germanica]|uniref:Uncharacterized protein n=1 Tax=Vespula germanica TaxID=30212 RepID=A0A834MWQ9_VESGE|nr:hypothetical protein HZH68_013611 [Vespula germanica]
MRVKEESIARRARKMNEKRQRVFRVLEPSKGCTIVTRSRATDQQSRRSNALLLCIVPGQIKKQGTHELRDLQRFEREGETTPEFPSPPPPPPLPPSPPSLSS